jgi:hypothetical protein
MRKTLIKTTANCLRGLAISSLTPNNSTVENDELTMSYPNNSYSFNPNIYTDYYRVINKIIMP